MEKNRQRFVFLVMGVSASGKSTVAKELAEQFNGKFIEADDFHSIQSKEKMAAGTPLEDADRIPWLEYLAGEIEFFACSSLGSDSQNVLVLSCSALKKKYRQILLARTCSISCCHCAILYLSVEFDEALRRSKKRTHFASPEIIENQFQILEIPQNELCPVLPIDTEKTDMQLMLKRAVEHVRAHMLEFSASI